MEINNVKDAIKFLNDERGTDVDDVSLWKWKIYDEDFTFFVKTDKELIDYAVEQQQDVLDNE